MIRPSRLERRVKTKGFAVKAIGMGRNCCREEEQSMSTRVTYIRKTHAPCPHPIPPFRAQPTCEKSDVYKEVRIFTHIWLESEVVRWRPVYSLLSIWAWWGNINIRVSSSKRSLIICKMAFGLMNVSRPRVLYSSHHATWSEQGDDWTAMPEQW